jgi:hypothetical protein
MRRNAGMAQVSAPQLELWFGLFERKELINKFNPKMQEVLHGEPKQIMKYLNK